MNKNKLLMFSIFACVSAFCISAPKDNVYWNASWIVGGSGYSGEYAVFKFRRNFELDEVPQTLKVNVSADNRYKLFVNGKIASLGPARGDLDNWYYEIVDIAPFLKKGKNTIAALMWNSGQSFSPAAQTTLRPSFILDSVDEQFQYLATGYNGWKFKIADAYSPLPAPATFLGGAERIDASKYDWGWEQPDFDDSKWKSAYRLDRGQIAPNHVGSYRRILTPRDIPPTVLVPQRFKSIRKVSGLESVPNFISGVAPFSVPANTKCELLIDNGVLTTAYPELSVSGGKGAEISIAYTEALYCDGSPKNAPKKGNRNEIEGKHFDPNPVRDVYLPDGGDNRVFSTLWYRPFRYVRMTVETRAEALVINDFSSVFTTYPFDEVAVFESDDKSLDEIWKVGWRTMRLCSNETFMDCPYYEQLQYIGDTRVEALVSVYVSGDARLMRKAIKMFNSSRGVSGLLKCSYPSFRPQYIPEFCLFWIQMLRDYSMLRDDPSFVREMLPSVRSILEWFENGIDPKTDMLRDDLPFWHFSDWSTAKNPESNKGLWGIWNNGCAPSAKGRGSAIHTLHFAATLRDASELMSNCGYADAAHKYNVMYQKLIKSVREKCWDKSRGLLLDYEGAATSSQHVNIWGILSDAIEREKQGEVFEKIMTEESLAQCSLYYRFYLAETMSKVGAGDKYITSLEPWRTMISDGLTTFAEKPGDARSDCHAWSASPNYHLLSLVAGIRPSSTGYGSVKIAPKMCDLKEMRVKVPHPRGVIEMNLKRQGNKLEGSVKLPQKLEGEFEWKGEVMKLRSGNNKIEKKY